MKRLQSRRTFALLTLACLVMPWLIAGCSKSTDTAPNAAQDPQRAERKRSSDK